MSLFVFFYFCMEIAFHFVFANNFRENRNTYHFSVFRWIVAETPFFQMRLFWKKSKGTCFSEIKKVDFRRCFRPPTNFFSNFSYFSYNRCSFLIWKELSIIKIGWAVHEIWIFKNFMFLDFSKLWSGVSPPSIMAEI